MPLPDASRPGLFPVARPLWALESPRKPQRAGVFRGTSLCPGGVLCSPHGQALWVGAVRCPFLGTSGGTAPSPRRASPRSGSPRQRAGLLRPHCAALPLQVGEGGLAALAAAGRVAQHGRPRARLCGEMRRGQASASALPDTRGAASLHTGPWQCHGWARGTWALPELLRHWVEPDGPSWTDRLLAGTQPSLPVVGSLTYLQRARVSSGHMRGSPRVSTGSYQRPSSPCCTSSTTSPLLTTSASGPPFSWSATTVYLPGTWWETGRGTGSISPTAARRTAGP